MLYSLHCSEYGLLLLIGSFLMPKELDYRRLVVEMEKNKMLDLKGYWPKVAEFLRPPLDW